MYYVFDGKNWYCFGEYKYLINWLAKFNIHFGSEVNNSFLNYVGNCDNDTCLDCTSIFREYVKRNHRILNEDYNSIYDALLVKDVLNWKHDPKLHLEWIYSRGGQKKLSWRGLLRYNDYPDFRNGPWPFTGCHKGGSGFRHFRTTNEIRQSADPEYKKFNRGSRGKHLPTEWDDVSRDWRNDGWKHQSKDRYQWEHGVRNKTRRTYRKGMYMSKSSDIKHAWDSEDWYDVGDTE